MKKEVENKIDATLNSLNGISMADANPYLFEKIVVRMEGKKSLPSIGIKWTFIAACVLVVLLNCSSVYYYFEKSEQEMKETAYQNIGAEMGFSQSYNY